MTKVYLSIGLLALAASLGVYLLSFLLRGKETPKGLAFLHGPLAAAGLVALAFASYESGRRDYWGPIAVFAVVAIGGLIMISIDLSGRRIPKWLGIVHGLAAASGFVWLLTHVF
ncbi:MAG: hypothetical protein M3436_00420 [Pseudomonadota bacterium]|nr:hypothetical protein [Pseudomonadota bacterium]